METSEREPSLAEALDSIIKGLNNGIADLTEKVEVEDAKISEIKDDLSKLRQLAKKADSELLEELLVIKKDIAAMLSHKNNAKKLWSLNRFTDYFLEFCAWMFLGFGIFLFLHLRDQTLAFSTSRFIGGWGEEDGASTMRADTQKPICVFSTQ